MARILAWALVFWGAPWRRVRLSWGEQRRGIAGWAWRSGSGFGCGRERVPRRCSTMISRRRALRASGRCASRAARASVSTRRRSRCWVTPQLLALCQHGKELRDPHHPERSTASGAHPQVDREAPTPIDGARSSRSSGGIRWRARGGSAPNRGFMGGPGTPAFGRRGREVDLDG